MPNESEKLDSKIKFKPNCYIYAWFEGINVFIWAGYTSVIFALFFSYQNVGLDKIWSNEQILILSVSPIIAGLRFLYLIFVANGSHYCVEGNDFYFARNKTKPDKILLSRNFKIKRGFGTISILSAYKDKGAEYINGKKNAEFIKNLIFDPNRNGIFGIQKEYEVQIIGILQSKIKSWDS